MRVVDRVSDIVIVQLDLVHDARGLSLDAYSMSWASRLGLPPFKHVYVSYSRRGVVRGLHYQLPPNVQGKFVVVVQGRIFDVVVDIRRSLPSFGKVYTFELRSGHGIWVPVGYAHGFQALEDALLVYLMSEEFVPGLYRCIRWDDPDLAVRWPISEVVVSEKDAGCPKFRDAEYL